MTADIEEVNDGNFAKIVLASTRPVLVDFWAQWCGPCRALAPVVESVAKHYAGSARVVKLNVDGNPSVVEKFKFEAIPTLIVFQNGEEKDRVIGAVGQAEIVERLDTRLAAAAN
ncbi:MAG TPA: thioredoxin [Candidatus Binatia bacterium]